jgi:hypothetical protein
MEFADEILFMLTAEDRNPPAEKTCALPFFFSGIFLMLEVLKT